MNKEQTYGISLSANELPSFNTGDASAVIQAALDSGARMVYIPYGIYRIEKGLLLSSETELRVHPEARLIFADGAGKSSSDFLISNRDPKRGNTNITISGGIWDGNNRGNPRGKEGDKNAYTGTMINMKNVIGLELRDMKLQDSTAYFTRLTRVKQFRIENISFRITHQTRNQDGIHCAGYCEDGDIHNIFAHGSNTTGDDLVALNADDALLRSELLGAEAGPIKNIRISNIEAEDCHSFVRMASIWAEISNIDIRDVRGGCRNMALNADALRYCLVPLFDSKDSRYANGVGMLRNIRYANAYVHKTGESRKALFCLESRMDNLSLVNIRRNLFADAQPQAPLLAVNNVEQGYFTAEYRISGSRNGNQELSGALTVAGNNDYVRWTKNSSLRSFTIPDSDHLVSIRVGGPTIYDLPPANNMVGMKV